MRLGWSLMVFRKHQFVLTLHLAQNVINYFVVLFHPSEVLLR
jgi:hypothetical protein